MTAAAAGNPSVPSLLAAIAITCAGLGGLSAAIPLAAPSRGRHVHGAVPAPGMSTAEPHDPDFVTGPRGSM